MVRLPYENNISSFSSLSTNVDSFVAELRYNISINCQPVYSNLFVETSATSGLFRCASAFTVGRDDLTVEVIQMQGTCQGSFIPFTERLKGPAGLLGSGDYTLEFMESAFDLEEEGGWFYPKGGSPLLAVAVASESGEPDICDITYYEPDSGQWKKSAPSDWKLEVKLRKADIAAYLAERRITIFDIILKDAETVIDHQGYAYITAEPRMPQLEASLTPSYLRDDAKWRLHIQYEREKYSGTPTYIPGPNSNDWTNVTTSVKWDIAREFGTMFRGGKAILDCEYKGIKCQKIFHIRGTNPTEAAVEEAIGNAPWYAIFIAKWESDRPSQGRYYAQFNTVGTLGPNPNDYKHCPNFGGPNGWGIFQLDPPPSEETLWNWKQNIADGKAHLEDPCLIEAADWIARQERQQQEDDPSKPLENYVFTFNGVDFQKGTARTPTDACTIQRYNGAKKRVIYWSRKTNTRPGSWGINAENRKYVDDVCGEIQ